MRALGTDPARLLARGLVSDWMTVSPSDPIARGPDVAGARITAWLGHYDFFAATADDPFRQRLMARLVSDARGLSAALPAEELDARALTALKGLIAAAVALPEHNGFLVRALRFLPREVARQVLPDGSHVERSPAAQLTALQDMTESIRIVQRLADGSDAGVILVRRGEGGPYSESDLTTLRLFLTVFAYVYREMIARRNEKDLIFSLNHRVLLMKQFSPASYKPGRRK